MSELILVLISIVAIDFARRIYMWNKTHDDGYKHEHFYRGKK